MSIGAFFLVISALGLAAMIFCLVMALRASINADAATGFEP